MTSIEEITSIHTTNHAIVSNTPHIITNRTVNNYNFKDIPKNIYEMKLIIVHTVIMLKTHHPGKNGVKESFFIQFHHI
jgi:hypothetical protein